MGPEDRLPVVDEEDAPFWAAARAHELRMQRCNSCGELWWPPGSVCPECWAEDFEWVELSGHGVVNSWVVFHRPYWPDVEDEVPYVVAEIEIEEGPRYIATVVGVAPDELSRGMPVDVVFRDVTDEVTLPEFGPR